MTYIPIQTSSSNKLVYVPVNSLQSNQRQPVVLYPSHSPKENNITSNSNAKHVLLSPQVLQTSKNVVVVPNNKNDGAFTTVRIQGNSQNRVQTSNIASIGTVATTPTSSTKTIKAFRTQFGTETHSQDYKITNENKSKQHELNPSSEKEIDLSDGKKREKLIMGTSSESTPVLSDVRHSTPYVTGSKRKHAIENDLRSSDMSTVQKKRRGRPPSCKLYLF